jgi:uncharacterized protein YdhG (YjbR/CyaY superfamily)
MKSQVSTPTTIGEYIAASPPPVRRRLSAMRATIRRHAPKAEERISYRIPTYFLDGNLVHFAAFARHIGFYPGPTGIAAFDEELSRYKRAKGSVQFPHDEPLPLDLVADIVKLRVAENTKGKVKGRQSSRTVR